jgi:hypothetical protein
MQPLAATFDHHFYFVGTIIAGDATVGRHL